MSRILISLTLLLIQFILQGSCTIGNGSVCYRYKLNLESVDEDGWNIECGGNDDYSCLCVNRNANDYWTCVYAEDDGSATRIWKTDGAYAEDVVLCSGKKSNVESCRDTCEWWGYWCDCSWKSGAGNKWNKVCMP